MREIITDISPEGIDFALRELHKWYEETKHKFELMLDSLASIGLVIASANFSQAQYDGTNDVSCRIEDRGELKRAIVATGTAVLFIEFGTGITYPDYHPEAVTHGMIRGAYGHHLGALQGGWRYYGDPGTNGEVITEGKHKGMVHTYGNPSNMCMYYTVQELQRMFENAAERYFGND